MKIDLHKSERNFECLNLSDINVIKWLILYRDKIDLYYGNKTDNFYDHAGNVKEINKELINLYVALDSLIIKCRLKNDQLALLELLFMGYTIDDIAEITKLATTRTLKNRFKSICKSIVEENRRDWLIYIHNNYLQTELRKCSQCGQELPLTDYFFHKDKKKGKNGFKSNCIKCRRTSSDTY